MASAQKSGCDVWRSSPHVLLNPSSISAAKSSAFGRRNAIEMWRTPRLADFEVDKALSHLDCARLCPAVQADALTESSPYRAKVNQPIPGRPQGGKQVGPQDRFSQHACVERICRARRVHFRISAIRNPRTVSASTTTG